MKFEEFRTRAQRFLNGDFRSEDLSALFLFMRNRPFGCETVRDIGNMRGHAEGRDRGVSLDRIKHQFQMLRIAMWRFAQSENAIDLNYAPSFLFDSIKATLESLDDGWIRNNLSMSRQQAGSTVAKLKKKFQDHNLTEIDDRYPRYLFGEEVKPKIIKICQKLEYNEIDLIRECTSRIVIKKAYNKNDLSTEFGSLLKRFGLVDENSFEMSAESTDKLAMFAAYAMHGLEFELPDGLSAKAKAGMQILDNDLRVAVDAGVNFKFPENDKALISFNIFDTELSPEDWVSPELGPFEPGGWTVPLELDSSAKLIEMKIFGK